MEFIFVDSSSAVGDRYTYIESHSINTGHRTIEMVNLYVVDVVQVPTYDFISICIVVVQNI